MKGLSVLRRWQSKAKEGFEISVNRKEDKTLRKIELQRKALISHQQQAFKEGRIEPMYHVIEKIQQALKKGEVTPMEKLEEALGLEAGQSYNNFMETWEHKYGNSALDLYGSEEDMRNLAILDRGPVVPERVRHEESMLLYRKYYVPNISVPGSIENINPNRFLRLKPKEEFPLLPIVPIAPSVLRRFHEELEAKRKSGYKFKIDKGKMYTSGITTACFVAFIFLLYFLYQKDEEHWIIYEKTKSRKGRNHYGFYY